jgi:hypothetical protein
VAQNRQLHSAYDAIADADIWAEPRGPEDAARTTSAVTSMPKDKTANLLTLNIDSLATIVLAAEDDGMMSRRKAVSPEWVMGKP